MIKVIDSLHLTKDGCCVINCKEYPVHIHQGDLDGACAVYSVMMYLMILKVVRRNQLEDLYNNIKKSPEVENLFHEFFDKHGLVRDGFYFSKLERMLKRIFDNKYYVKSYDGEICSDKSFIQQIKVAIDENNPIMLGIDFKGGGAHAILAIGYESDDDGVFNVFCLDPGYQCPPTSYWNVVISLNVNKGKYKHLCITENTYRCPSICISETLLITKNKIS